MLDGACSVDQASGGDASVRIAAADTAEVFHEESRTFLVAAAQEGTRILIPAFAVAEVACALART